MTSILRGGKPGILARLVTRWRRYRQVEELPKVCPYDGGVYRLAQIGYREHRWKCVRCGRYRFARNRAGN